MRQPNTNSQLLLTVPEVALILRTGPARVRQYVREGKLLHILHGRRILIPSSEAGRFVYEQSQRRLLMDE